MIIQEEIREKEKELEEISKKVGDFTMRKGVPIFEIFVTAFSLALSILIFQFPEMLYTQAYESGVIYYVFGALLDIFPSHFYGIAFFTAAMFKAVGLLASKKSLRVTGLGFSAALYLLFSMCLFISFPSILFIVFVDLFVFSAISIPLVSSTSLSTKKEKL